MILTFDVETSGLIIRDRPLDDPAQPRMVQLGFTVHTPDRRVVHSYSALIRPDGWEITPEAQRVHGFSTEDCGRWGVDSKVALLDLVSALKTARIAVAHNFANDAAIAQRELNILKAADEGFMRARLRRVCTMRTGAALVQDGKWPTLGRLHKLLAGHEHEGAHDALGDAQATARCFWGLVDRKVIEL
ncbi:Exonuclease RNase T and DNA polymerase III [Methylorubrum populi BJ001]|jgi:DNA polymerase III epsilon subunit-like protein|uniref:Exonuclease RNase T and DNA polymerase III n=1 Tax=Methylorubrum populi (strain ATCC BAA-705 / NCIMB 13946 / BJ001) TaxID=441620 RepID=B1ZD08_METPB|nr:3'-5' exonuclease [Methylorubrum populi]ACB80877.1 Exonuclease RNase T and DNA polymerase III [Methylorubrum populi BJ001]